MQTLKFSLDETGMGVVTLDGHPVCVRSISFAQTAGEPADVTLVLCVKVEGELMVEKLVSKGPEPWPID